MTKLTCSKANISHRNEAQQEQANITLELNATFYLFKIKDESSRNDDFFEQRNLCLMAIEPQIFVNLTCTTTSIRHHKCLSMSRKLDKLVYAIFL